MKPKIKGAAVKKVQLERQEAIQRQIDLTGCTVCKGTGRQAINSALTRHSDRPECPCCNGTGKRQPGNPACSPKEKDFRPRRVVIVKSESPAKWYHNRVHEVFNVVPFEDLYRVIPPVDPETDGFLKFLIDPKDCEEVKL